ncbi:MAG: hypothetical protein IPF99_15065 [Deltaproteobacteria bacterium]|nr:hypothetical protein [Deltaproteobacteria bacterium]MBK7065924.1 hypothetical protein [Deltaproteobacteria bacterium]MBP6833175.1 hypothetical protein [Deltaproteobacteria bacterium]
MTEVPLDLDRLLKLRLVVARFGEMDGARWWNTSGQLATSGAAEAFRETFGTEVRELNVGAIVEVQRTLSAPLIAGTRSLPRTVPITLPRSEKDACDGRLREECARLIGAGKKVVLS